MKHLSTITQLQTIRKQKQQLTEKETQLLTPILTELSDVQTLYNIFSTLMENHQTLRLTDDVIQRKKFIFIALCFFSPGTLAGHRFPSGLRATLAKVLNTYPTFISDNIENVGFQYQKIKAYREELEYLYSEIENQLITIGKIDTLPHKTTEF